MKIIKTTKYLFLSLSLFSSLLVTGCYKASMPAMPSGFIGDYSNLKPVNNDVGTLFFLDKDIDWKKYHSIMIYPVQIKFIKESKHFDIKRDDLIVLGQYFRREMHKAVEGKYKVVKKSGPGVLKLRVAITDVKPTDVVANIISKTLFYLPVDMGEAAMEGNLTDSLSGKPVAAIVDRKIGSVFSTSLGYTKWGHVKDAFEEWSAQLINVLEKQVLAG